MFALDCVQIDISSSSKRERERDRETETETETERGGWRWNGRVRVQDAFPSMGWICAVKPPEIEASVTPTLEVWPSITSLE